MKIYSDKDIEIDINQAAPVGCNAYSSPIGRTRVRRFGWDVQLYKPSSNRHYNSGTYGASSEKGAATRDDHGEFFANPPVRSRSQCPHYLLRRRRRLPRKDGRQVSEG